MSPWKMLLVATAAFATLLAADATVETTCKAAAAMDIRIDYSFCVSELGKHRDSAGADTWGLAKVAANLGANNAGGAVNDVDALLAKPPGADGAKEREALGQCRKLYSDMELAFAGAHDEIDNRQYEAAKETAEEGLPLALRCNAVFAEAKIQVPSALAQRGKYAKQISVLCMTITDLIK